jgi:hypothetical protein
MCKLSIDDCLRDWRAYNKFFQSAVFAINKLYLRMEREILATKQHCFANSQQTVYHCHLSKPNSTTSSSFTKIV